MPGPTYHSGIEISQLQAQSALLVVLGKARANLLLSQVNTHIRAHAAALGEARANLSFNNRKVIYTSGQCAVSTGSSG